MTAHVVISVVALSCYGGLLALTGKSGVKSYPSRRIFFIYLIAMVLQQVTYLMVSIATTPESALTWYTVMLATGTAPWPIYYAFTRSLTQKPHCKAFILGMIFWAVTSGVAVFLTQPYFYQEIVADPVAGIFVPRFGPAIFVLGFPVSLFTIMTAFELLSGYRRSETQQQRMRIQYLLLGLIVVLLGTIANAPEASRPYPLDVIGNCANACLIGYAISQHRLLDISHVARQGVLFSIPTAILGAAYFLIIYTATWFFGTLDSSEMVILSVVVAILGAATTRPLLDKTRDATDRLIFRESHELGTMVQRLSRQAASILNLDALSSMILEDVRQTMNLEWAALFVRTEEELKLKLIASTHAPNLKDDEKRWGKLEKRFESFQDERSARSSDAIIALDDLMSSRPDRNPKDEPAVAVKLSARGRFVGVFAVGPKTSQRDFTQEDQLALRTLANQIAVAVDNARLHETVRAELAERKRAEREKEQIQAQLHQMQKMEAVATLAGGVAHDMNNILASIMGIASTAKIDLERGHNPHPDDVDHILVSCTQGRDLIDALLGFASEQRHEKREVSLNGVIEKVIALLQRTISPEINIKTKLDAGLKAVRADPSQMSTVMMNLCVNAASSIGPSGLLKIVSDNYDVLPGNDLLKKGLLMGPYARIRVIDNGEGMSSRDIQRILDPDPTVQPHGNATGFGLSTVQNIIRRYSGTLTIESKLNQGTTVSIFIPASAKSSQEIRFMSSVPPPEKKIRKLDVLLVDDDPMVRRAGQRLLRHIGWNVRIAADGQEAVEIFSKDMDSIDLVILDMIMPRMDGDAVFRALRKIKSDLPIILCSGYTKDGKAENLLKKQAVTFVGKPFESDALIQAAAEVLSKRLEAGGRRL